MAKRMIIGTSDLNILRTKRFWNFVEVIASWRWTVFNLII